MNLQPSLLIRQPLITVLIAFVFFMIAQPAFGQTTTLKVQVTDAEGNPIPGATVEAINKVTKKRVTGLTLADGTVELVVPEGEYDVTVQSTGFAKSVLKDLKVTVTESRTTTVAMATAPPPPPPPLPPAGCSRRGSPAACAP